MIRIHNLRKQFRASNPRKAFSLKIETLNIQDGEVVYFLGPNGSGKTTLLALLQGSMAADSGSVEIVPDSDRPPIRLMDLEPHHRAKYLGMVPQDSDEALVNEMTIADHILVGLSRSKAVPLFFPRLRSRALLKRVLSPFELGFENRLDELVGNLSGGERQVLTFCMATAVRPAVMLLDEFTSALDPEMAHKVLNTVMDFLRINGLTALIVTHRHKEAIDYAHRIVILHKGRPYCELIKGEQDFNEDRVKAVFSDLYSVEGQSASVS